MNDRRDRERKTEAGERLTTIVERVRPAIVVRRRVVEIERSSTVAVPDSGATTPPSDEDEGGPPSSVNVSRALASLRADELRRVEALIAADEDADDEDAGVEEADEEEAEPVAVAPIVPSSPSRPELRVPKTITLSELARRMIMSRENLTTALVSQGYFSLAEGGPIPRETVREIATVLGWKVDVVDEQEEPKTKRSRAAADDPSKKKAKRRS